MSTKIVNRFAIFDLIKLILAILVINLHVESFITGAPFSPLYYLGKFAVPLFIIFNFYFNGKYFTGYSTNHLFIHKLKRLLFPFVVWSIIGFIASPELISLKYIARQIFTGTAVDAPLYYLLAVFWISIFYYGVSRLVKSVTLFHFGLIFAIIIYEILGLNLIIREMLPIQIEFFVSRTLEFTKYASLGIILSIYQDSLKFIFSKYRRALSLLAIISPLLLSAYYYLSMVTALDYSGLWLFIISIIIMFSLIIDSHQKFPLWLNRVAYFGTYTLGLYCLHTFFIEFVTNKFPILINLSYLVLSFAISVLSLAISFILSRYTKLKPLVQ